MRAIEQAQPLRFDLLRQPLRFTRFAGCRPAQASQVAVGARVIHRVGHDQGDDQPPQHGRTLTSALSTRRICWPTSTRSAPSLATPQAVLASEKFERFDAVFSGAGDTLAAALAALIAGGADLAAAATEALAYLDRCLDGGFRPGMGHVVPDRLFWAQPDAEAEDEADTPSAFELPAHDTKH